jgi:16S rRNA processing protein RimM
VTSKSGGAGDSSWVTVALLGKTRGNRGELTALAFHSDPERYQRLHEVFLFGPEPEPRRAEVESAWFHGGVLILKFRGIDSISDAAHLSGAEVRVPMSERAPLKPGAYFHSDLIGCEVVDRSTGAPLGRVTDFQETGGAGLLVIDGDWLIPFARSICVEIDTNARRIAVDLPEGLKDVNRP